MDILIGVLLKDFVVLALAVMAICQPLRFSPRKGKLALPIELFHRAYGQTSFK